MSIILDKKPVLENPVFTSSREPNTDAPDSTESRDAGGGSIYAIERELGSFVASGGPFPHEYGRFLALIEKAALAIRTERISMSQWTEFLDSFGPAFDENTIQGFCRRKPHGYSGDFEVIDRLYTHHLSPNPALVRWDRFLQAQSAPKAVRNRKAYFASLLLSLDKTTKKLEVLNVGSGPGRDVSAFFDAHPGSNCHIVCLDHDINAIAHARQLCSAHLSRIDFVQKNALRFQTDRRFHLIWSAGLFDYLDDKVFVFLLRKLGSFLQPGGHLVIGNFSQDNPTQVYMEVIGSWFLKYRTPQDLARLASAAGFKSSAVSIQSEETGLNLFLHAKQD